MNAPALARAGAIAIALAALFDPSWTRDRIVPLPVSLIAEPASRSFADRVRRDLAGTVDIRPAHSLDTQAVIVIRGAGEPLPAEAAQGFSPADGRVFVIDDPDRAAPFRIRAFDMPRVALRGRAIAATAHIDVIEPGSGPLKIELRAGDRLVASEERDAPRRGALTVPLGFAPADAGLLPLRLEITQGGAVARAATAVRVEDRPLRVLVIDPRPSWTSTFVRRALEEDPAFEVRADTATSRGVSVVAGDAARLDDVALREGLDVVVVGTPSALPAGTGRSLDTFARERGGAVVLLADQDAGRLLEQVTDVGWQRRVFAEPATASAAHGSFQLSDALLPSTIPPAAAALAALGADARPVVQMLPAGRGRMIVSGALDAWRFRAAPGSHFEAFWRGVIGDAALAAAAPLSVTLTPSHASPGSPVDVEVVVRDMPEGGAVTVEAALKWNDRVEAVRLWPAAGPGVFTARISAPAAEGAAVVSATSTSADLTASAEAPLIVAATPPLANASDAAPRVLASTRGGEYIPGGDIGALRDALGRAFPAHRAPVTTHPMRYAAWLVPFTLLLGYEWRWRRQRGLK